jgi:hypothetical protein
MTQPLCMVIAHRGSKVVDDCLRSLQHWGWHAQRFDAIESASISPMSWRDIGVQMLARGKMPRRPGAQGCWHSHWRLWNICATNDQPLVVMEHDALVQRSWPTDLDMESAVTKLYSSAPCKTNDITGRWSLGSHAYTITPRHARLLIAHAQAHGAQALDKHLGDRVIDWRFLDWDLVKLNPRRGASTTARSNT